MNQLRNYNPENNTAEFYLEDGTTTRRTVKVCASRDWPFNKPGRVTYATAKPVLLENEILVEEIGGRMTIIKTKG